MNGAKRRDYCITVIGGAIIVCVTWLILRYLRLGLPHMYTDEVITVSRVLQLSSDIKFELNYFKYPGLNFYFGAFAVKILNRFFPIIAGLFDNKTYMLRVIYVGSALLSTFFLYLGLKRLFKSRKAALFGSILSVSSLYIPQFLYYVGPDTLLICWGNIFLFLSAEFFTSGNEDRSVYMLYPLSCILTGMAMSTKYHAVLYLLIPAYIHICKGYYKRYRNNFVAVMSLTLIPITFAACNLYMFSDFKLFMEDFFFNIEHYKGGHVGLDDNVPIITYLRTFLFSGFGYVGGCFVMLGIIRLFKKKQFALMGLLMIVPAAAMVILGRYKIFLARNIALVIPFRYVFMTTGIVYAWELTQRLMKNRLKRPRLAADVSITALLLVMLVPNLAAYITIPRLDDSRIAATTYIEQNIPVGSTVYITQGIDDGGGYYMPYIDEHRYHIITDSTELNPGDYIVDTSYRWKRWYNKSTYILNNWGGGEYLYPNMLNAYEAELTHYELVKHFSGLSFDTEVISSNITLLKYLTMFWNQTNLYWGPSIDIYIETH